MFKASSNPQGYYFIIELMWALLWAIITLHGASGMSICPWPIPALRRHHPSVNTMDNNRSFMDDEDGCEVLSLYMAGIPGKWIPLQLSKLSPRWLTWYSRLYNCRGRLGGYLSGSPGRAEKLITMVRLPSFSFTPSFICLFSSPCLFSWVGHPRTLREYPVYVWHLKLYYVNS